MAIERKRHLDGAIDDARIYSRALSAEEVAVLGGGNSAYDPASPVGYAAAGGLNAGRKRGPA